MTSSSLSRIRDQTGGESDTSSRNSMEIVEMPVRLFVRSRLISSISRSESSSFSVTNVSTRWASAPGKRVLTFAALGTICGSSIRGRIMYDVDPATRIKPMTRIIKRGLR